MARKLNRREFIGSAAATGAGVWVTGRQPIWAQEKGPNAKLNVACIGTGGRGFASVEGCKGENIVALCDVDENRLNDAAKKMSDKHPNAKKYTDYRKMLDEVGKEIDAVTVGTPDHHHAPAAVRAMRMGKHAYVEKPMTHSIYEARTLTQIAAEKKLATQMGNQGHSTSNRRLLVEALQQGVIGKVTEVHAWTNRPIWPQAIDRPKREDPVPPHLHWDEWIGPAPMRPYADKTYHDFKWRGWWDFGTGALGDMACHIMDAAFWGLKLGYPTHVETEGEPLHPETGPKWMIVRLQFPQRGELPPVKYAWYDGGKLPPQDLAKGVTLQDKDGKILVPNGNIIVGDKGTIVVTDEQTGNWKVYADGKAPVDKKELKIEQTLPRVPGDMGGHHGEWITACKGGPKSLGDFSYSGPFTETVLIGIVSFRTGKKLEWDGQAMKAKNCPEADPYIKREYRKGWEV
jgi:predicted dehydrogenase